MKVPQPITLEGRIARLEPLAHHHAPGLLENADPEIYRYHTPPPDYSIAGFEQYIDNVNALENWLPFAIVLKESGAAIGVTCYLDIRVPHHGLEIGFTWLGFAHQGTKVNPECKYLLLRHAFDDLGAMRVQLKTDLRNVQSQRAIEKLGAQREGVHRKHMIIWDGSIRHTVMYAITDEDWPAVRAGLEARLGYAP